MKQPDWQYTHVDRQMANFCYVADGSVVATNSRPILRLVLVACIVQILNSIRVVQQRWMLLVALLSHLPFLAMFSNVLVTKVTEAQFPLYQKVLSVSQRFLQKLFTLV